MVYFLRGRIDVVIFCFYEKIRKKEGDITRRMQKLLCVLFRIVKILRHGAQEEIDLGRLCRAEFGFARFRVVFLLSQMMIQIRYTV